MSAQPQPQLPVTMQAYLAAEQLSTVKHEYAAGQVFAMAGASERHNRIAMNVGASLHQATRHGHCGTFISDMRVKIDQVIYYPDVMVACDPTDSDPYLKSAPCLIVEVLSNSTERIDRGEKLYNYQKIPQLSGHLLIAQDQLRVDVYRRAGVNWLFETYSDLSDVIRLDCPETTLGLAEIYERIVFPNPELVSAS